ncbi:MAG TPA: hypothetical protein VIE43_12390 [Thermoanaerobaculia bacterium]|jgi:hypothetical protein|nr:hypothetical protein [Thermoanaerobaculia bacterium]
MKKSLACCLALAALGLAAPMRAKTVYVPVLEPVNATGAALATQLWISNFGPQQLPYATSLLQADGVPAATKSLGATVPADRAVYLDKVAAEGETGLLAVDASEDLLINAWVQSGQGKQTFYTGLPVISTDNQIAAGATTYLNGVGRLGSRDTTQVALVNLGPAAAQCQVDVVDGNGAFLRSVGTLEVSALSMKRYDDALGLHGAAAASAKVSCDQPFYAMAVTVDAKTSQVSFINPADAVEKSRKPATPTAPPTIPNPVVFDQPGYFHLATKDNPKKILRIPVPAAFSARRVSAEFDIVAGPWNPRLKKGAHNLIFFHRGKFRSNTLANINAFGPNNNKVKDAQNIDLPAKYNTQLQLGYLFQQGQTYHISMLYSAFNKNVTFGIYQNGNLIKGGTFAATAKGGILTIPATGLVAEFGNYNNQGLPEVSSLGWKFGNFHVEIAH